MRKLERADFIDAAWLLALMLLFLVLGSLMSADYISHRCLALGAFKHHGTVYECHVATDGLNSRGQP